MTKQYMNNCKTCGLPNFYGPASYAGPVCICSNKLSYQHYKSNTDGCKAVEPITEERIRKIIREEISKMKDLK